MTAAAARTSYERARANDEEHKRELLSAIMAVFAGVSKVSDANVMMMPTGEAANALLSALAFILSLSPAATLSPTAMRKMLDELGRRRRRDAQGDSEVQDFVRGCFYGDDEAGHA